MRFMPDGNGLLAQVSANGDRIHWYVRFQWMGKLRGFSLGKFPLITLAEARAAREVVQRLLAVKINPSDNKDKVIAAIRDYRNALDVGAEHAARIAAMEARNRFHQDAAQMQISQSTQAMI